MSRKDLKDLNTKHALELMRSECIKEAHGSAISVADAVRLEKNTAPIRGILNHGFPIRTLEKIRNLLDYYKYFCPDMFGNNLPLLLTSLYDLGYIEGKRAERERKGGAAPDSQNGRRGK